MSRSAEVATLAEIESRIESFIRSTLDAPRDGLSRYVDIFKSGFVDSVGVIQLLVFIESEFETQIPEDDLLSPEFSRIEGMARIVARRVRGIGGPVA